MLSSRSQSEACRWRNRSSATEVALLFNHFCSIKQGLLGRFPFLCTWPTFSVEKTIRTQSPGPPPAPKPLLSQPQSVSPGNICEGGCSVTSLSSISQTGRGRPAGLTSSGPQREAQERELGGQGLSSLDTEGSYDPVLLFKEQLLMFCSC